MAGVSRGWCQRSRNRRDVGRSLARIGRVPAGRLTGGLRRSRPTACCFLSSLDHPFQILASSHARLSARTMIHPMHTEEITPVPADRARRGATGSERHAGTCRPSQRRIGSGWSSAQRFLRDRSSRNLSSTRRDRTGSRSLKRLILSSSSISVGYSCADFSFASFQLRIESRPLLVKVRP